MPEVKPLKLMDVGGGAGELREFGVSDTLPADNLPANVAALAGLTGAADKLHFFTAAGALALSDYTAAARTFNAAGTVPEQRTVLGLVPVVSPTDTTANSLLTVGYMGLGGLSALAAADYNDINVGRFARFAAAAANAPVALDTNTLNMASSGATNTQIAMPWIGSIPRLYFRSQLSTYSPWALAWSSLGTNAITVDTGSFGYGTGSGGTVTQATSKSTGVTLNKPAGAITLNAAALAAASVVSFTLTNNKIAAADVPVVAIKSGATAGAYTLTVDEVVAGSCRISLRNNSGGSLAEAIVISLVLNKGATA